MLRGFRVHLNVGRLVLEVAVVLDLALGDVQYPLHAVHQTVQSFLVSGAYLRNALNLGSLIHFLLVQLVLFFRIELGPFVEFLKGLSKRLPFCFDH